MKSSRLIWLLSLGAYIGWMPCAQADEEEFGPTEVVSNIPPAPDFRLINSSPSLDKAIKIELDESFVPKIISSMKKEPF